MDLTIKKFTDDLEEYIEANEKIQFKKAFAMGKEHDATRANACIEKVVIAKNLIYYFQTTREDIGIVFNEFSFFSTYLLQSSLNIEEQMKMICEVCKRNCSLYHPESSILLYDLKKVRKFRFSNMNEKEAALLWFDSIFPNIFDYNATMLTDESMKTKKALIHSPNLFTFNDQDILDNCNIIKTCYLDKMNCYTKQDVDKIIRALMNLKINKELCQKIRNFLFQEINQRLDQDKLENIQDKKKISPIFKKEEWEQVLNRNRVNYKEVYSELKDVVDLSDMTTKCSLSLEQSIYYTSLLLSIKVKFPDIQKFLKNVEIENNGTRSHPITLYLELYDKLKYYAGKLVLLENLKLLEDYFQEMWIVSDEEYGFWKSNFEQELNNYIREIPGSFDYEFKEARKKLERKMK